MMTPQLGRGRALVAVAGLAIGVLAAPIAAEELRPVDPKAIIEPPLQRMLE